MLTIQEVSNPEYTNHEGTGVNLTVKFAEFPEPIPFHATDFDTEAHGKVLYSNAKAGMYGPIKVYVEPPKEVTDGNQPNNA